MFVVCWVENYKERWLVLDSNNDTEFLVSRLISQGIPLVEIVIGEVIQNLGRREK